MIRFLRQESKSQANKVSFQAYNSLQDKRYLGIFQFVFFSLVLTGQYKATYEYQCYESNKTVYAHLNLTPVHSLCRKQFKL